MKKHLSVLALFAGSIFLPLVLILFLMTAVEIGGFYLFGFHRAWSFGQSEGDVFLLICFLAAFILLSVFLILPGSKEGTGYTLMRLKISEEAAFLWHAVICALAYLALWAAEALILYLLSQSYAAGSYYTEGPQGIFLAFYRRGFFFSILPLDAAALWVRNILFVTAAGLAVACFSLFLRHRRKSFLSLLTMTLIVGFFRTTPEYLTVNAAFSTVISILCIGLLLRQALKTAHGGKGGSDDEKTQ